MTLLIVLRLFELVVTPLPYPNFEPAEKMERIFFLENGTVGPFTLVLNYSFFLKIRHLQFHLIASDSGHFLFTRKEKSHFTNPNQRKKRKKNYTIKKQKKLERGREQTS